MQSSGCKGLITLRKEYFPWVWDHIVVIMIISLY